MYEVERDHQAADPAVAVEEGVDGLELVMGQRSLEDMLALIHISEPTRPY